MADLLDLILPVDCVACRSAGVQLCSACRADIGRGPRVSRWLRPGLELTAVGAYGGPLRDVVLACKRTGSPSLIRFLAGLAAQALVATAPATRSDPMWLVPVHSGGGTRRRAGGDLVTVLARRVCRLARRLGAPILLADLLRVHQPVRAQKSLGRIDRLTNVTGAMHVRERQVAASCRYVVFDDVVTTGATVLDADRALRAAGARVAGVLALASA